MSIFKKNKRYIVSVFLIVILLASISLGFHNASIYNPRHGFDGNSHLYYINYIFRYKEIPEPNWAVSGVYGENHQPPLYYLIGALTQAIFGTWKAAQYVNTIILWMIIGMVGLGLKKILKRNEPVLIGMFSLAALPMLNIFPAMISNELLNTFWIISIGVSTIYLVSAKNSRMINFTLAWLALSFILGIWTKMSILLIVPTICSAFILLIIKNRNSIKSILFKVVLTIFCICIFSLPIVLRNQTQPNASNVVNIVAGKRISKNPDFYYRLDWIPKVDMYTTQYYSFLGAAWNSFWTDGHNAITPFVEFHKKSFILWSLGFILLPLSLYGATGIFKANIKYSILLSVIASSMLGGYFLLNFGAAHYSAARLTYEMGIVFPYAVGIAAASEKRKLKFVILFLLTVQFATMVSFYWIQPWWHVTR